MTAHAPLPDADAEADTALHRVRAGWHHLQLQRPLAAWASWQRALRIDPDHEAARRAVDTLATAPELPAPARAVYRFRNPADPALRSRWDDRLRGRELSELDAAADAFAALTNDNPADADAWDNLALCRAWMGRNADAVACLDRVVSLRAAADPERAEAAWTLAEVLRQGAGAEPLADDFRYAWVLDRLDGPAPAPADALFARWPDLVPVPMPTDPITGERQLDAGQVYEWLDRSPDAAGPDVGRAQDLPRVLATVIRTPALVRISSPDPSGLAALEATEVGRALAGARREKTPLPIAWSDSALGTFRLPAGLDDAARASLSRSVVEHYFEDLWVHQPRQALGGLTPLESARVAGRGDVVARARLAAVVRYREHLGSRSTHAAVYQGYPFDRLRRRLGLVAAVESVALDADDVTCMSERELDALDAAALDDHRLAQSFLSAASLCDDARAARFAAALARRAPSARAGLDPAAVFAPLVRESLRLGDPDEALDWLKTALTGAGETPTRVFTVWSAEIQARSGRPDAALRAYLALLSRPGSDAALALDGAETLLDNGHPEQALPLLLEARTRARQAGDGETLRTAEALLARRTV